jgi:RNA polymerase sigma-70 factor (ECF subfamily)
VLLQRASSRDSRAFSELHALTRTAMRKAAFAAGASAGDIDDILQEAYLKIWRNAGRFDCHRASALAWMRTIVRNTAIDSRRARKLPTSALDEALAVACLPDADDFDYAGAESLAVSAIARLPEARRRLIALAFIDGESRATLSQRFGVPVGTIKTWLHRTLLAVRKDCLAAPVHCSQFEVIRSTGRAA